MTEAPSSPSCSSSDDLSLSGGEPSPVLPSPETSRLLSSEGFASSLATSHEESFVGVAAPVTTEARALAGIDEALIGDAVPADRVHNNELALVPISVQGTSENLELPKDEPEEFDDAMGELGAFFSGVHLSGHDEAGPSLPIDEGDSESSSLEGDFEPLRDSGPSIEVFNDCTPSDNDEDEEENGPGYVALRRRNREWLRSLRWPPTKTTRKSLRRLINRCHIQSPICFRIPSPSQRPWSAPDGYICLYEYFFKDCGMQFPIPELFVNYCARRKVAFTQMAPAAVKNIMAYLILGADCGVNVTTHFFEELTRISISPLKDGTFYVSTKNDLGVAHGFPSKINGWKDHYFYVRIDSASVLDPWRSYRIAWRAQPGINFDRAGVGSFISLFFLTLFLFSCRTSSSADQGLSSQLF